MVSTSISRRKVGGSTICASVAHVVIAAGSEAIREIVGAVIRSTRGKQILVAVEVSHYEGCVYV